MSSVIYIGKAVYAVENTAEEHNIHLYVERRGAEYYCIAYNPDNKHMVGHCCFTELLYTLDKAAAKAVKIMGIQCANIRRIKRDAEAAGTAQEPDLKICILKALAGQVHQEDCESETIHNMLKIIEML